jgi:predicted TIM-barrel fold metal-dependent hydrolase
MTASRLFFPLPEEAARLRCDQGARPRSSTVMSAARRFALEKPKRYPAALVEYMRGHGRGKVLFGTNYPMIVPAKALEGLDALSLDDESRQLFLSGNACRVFKL